VYKTQIWEGHLCRNEKKIELFQKELINRKNKKVPRRGFPDTTWNQKGGMLCGKTEEV